MSASPTVTNCAILATIVACLTACGPVYDLDQPFGPLQLRIPTSAYSTTFQPTLLQSSYAEALNSIKAKTTNDGTQIAVDFDPQCLCSTCDASTVAYVLDTDLSRIIFCPRIQDRNRTQISGVVKHELAHILARRFDHLLCETGALMTPQYSCRVIPDQYTKLDIDYICSTGLQGGACER